MNKYSESTGNEKPAVDGPGRPGGLEQPEFIMTHKYSEFINGKLGMVDRAGIDVPLRDYGMFPHQVDLTRWALRRGCAAIFADTGLGKSRMQVAWADTVNRETRRDVLILAPLAVAEQTVEEGHRIGVTITHAREQSDVKPGINITNYDRLHKFDTDRFGAVVLDESSIIKHHTAKTLQTLLAAFRHTPYKLACTATPAPNDWTELGNHAEFLGVRTRAEMLAEFFVHDGGDTQTWRLKGHARQIFWRWVATWGAMLRSPADLGYDASAYLLPPLDVHQHSVEIEHNPAHGLFAMEAQTLMERRDARRASLVDRVRACELLVKAEWAKMAASEIMGGCHGMEEGIRGSSEAEGGYRSGISCEAQCAIDEGQGSPQVIHAGVLQGQPREIPAKDAGEASRVQRETPGEVCRESGIPRCNAGECEGMAAGQSAQEEVSEAQKVRHDACGILGHDDGAGRSLCDLRASGHGETELLSGGGSLPRQREGARPAVYELQSGHRKVQGRSRTTAPSGRIHLEPWLIWCDLNAEQDALRVAFGDLAFSVQGSDTEEHKEYAIRAWLRGERPVMISKVSILGFGLNFQHCNHMAFVGVTDSFEAYYQAVRRSWRFGQTKPVNVHIFASNQEGAVVANLKRKEQDAQKMADAMALETIDAVRSSVIGNRKETNIYAPDTRIQLPNFMRAAA